MNILMVIVMKDYSQMVKDKVRALIIGKMVKNLMDFGDKIF